MLSVSGHTLANSTRGDVRLRKASTAKKADADWAAQQWQQQAVGSGSGSTTGVSEFALMHVATGYCLTLQGDGSTNLEVAPCEAGIAAQTLAYNSDDGTLRFSRAPYTGLLVNTC